MAENNSTTMTVSSTDPLQVLADGAETPAPAVSVTGLALAVGNRVQVTIRNPNRPLITGKVETS